MIFVCVLKILSKSRNIYVKVEENLFEIVMLVKVIFFKNHFFQQ